MALRTLFASALLLCLVACSPGPSSVTTVAEQGLLSGDIARNGSGILIGSIHHGGSYWRLQDNERVYDWNLKPGGFSSYRSVALSGNGLVGVTTEEDTLGVWDASTGESTGFWQTPNRILSVDIDERGRTAVLGLRDNQAVIIDLSSGQTLHELTHDSEVRTVAIDAQGELVLTGSDDRTAKLWSAESGDLLHTFALENQVKTVALSANGQRAFITSQRETAKVIDTQTFAEQLAIENRYTNYTAVAFSDDNKEIMLGTFQGEVLRYDLATGEKQSSWQSKPKQLFGSATSKAIVSVQSVSGRVVALTSDGQIQYF